jgi:PAS domain S-box-containing protein
MKDGNREAMRAARLVFGVWCLVFGVSLRCLSLGAQELPVLRTAEEVRRLSPDEADRHYPVRLVGVLTFFDQHTPTRAFRFIQDETAGIYFYPDAGVAAEPLATGQKVEMEGQTGKGEFAPIVVAHRIQILGPGVFPTAKPVSFEQLLSGQEDSQFIEIKGTARSVQMDPLTNYYCIEIATGDGRVTAYASELPGGPELADSRVKARGVCLTQFNLRRQLFDVRMIIPRVEDLVVEESGPPGDPFAVPAQSIGALLQFSPEATFGRRVKVAGWVTCRPNDAVLYIQDETEGLYAETSQRGLLQPGDRIEILGFPAHGEYTPMLQDAVFRKTGSGPVPAAEPITVDEALRGTHDCRLVRLEATLLNRSQRGRREELLVLQTSNLVFQASLEGQGPSTVFSSLQNGSKVAVTGVCLIEKGGDWFAGEGWRAKSFHLLLRSPEDVHVLQRPPWWTLQRLLWVLGALGAAVLGALAWVAVLRRRVHKQTHIIRQKLEVEAALKERYLDLFENANDIVYTHDLAGRLTSINEAGEHLLQRPREEILSRNIVELVVPEQQTAAQQWLEQVLKDAAPPTAEWDFAAASGQPVKLEISTRRLAQNGQVTEVEGIARDITERKRLERELLEISNREQRRIGHDLHDGVCQQLVGIAYLTETLADRLQEKALPESGDAERISYLINSTLNQTRGVARGLFPVRLEENGLPSALEELAANASTLFQLACAFSCPQPPQEVDNAIALHLYYIAQEAVANAAKHGQAKHVQITLQPFKDRYALAVQDDGAGFSLNGHPQTGMGLRIMRYRARVIGATLEVNSAPGEGTTVRCVFGPGTHA